MKTGLRSDTVTKLTSRITVDVGDNVFNEALDNIDRLSLKDRLLVSNNCLYKITHGYESCN